MRPGQVFELTKSREVQFDGGHSVTLGFDLPSSYYEVLPDPPPQVDPVPSEPALPEPPEGGPHEPSHREPIVQNREARPRRRRALKEAKE